MAEVAVIAGMSRSDLLKLWRETIEAQPPSRLSTPLLTRIVAFEVQALRNGDLPSEAKKRFARIAAGRDRPVTPGLRPGGRLVRDWNGVSHVVDVVAGGFIWRGERYQSLSAVAREITGARWSGPRFFGLTGRAGG